MDKRKLERERLLFRYSAALERGDFDTVDAVLRVAGKDPALEAMLLEVNAVYADEGSSGFSRDFDPFKIRTQEAPDGMNASIALNRGARPAPVRNRNAVNLFSMAAVIAVVVFAAAIVTRIPPSNGTNGPFLGSANLDQSQQVDTTTGCWLVITAPQGAPVLSRPDLGAGVIAVLEQGTQVRFVEYFDVAHTVGGVVRWIYVEAPPVAGWIMLGQAETSSTDPVCENLAQTDVVSTSTPLPTAVPLPVDPADVPPPVVDPVPVDPMVMPLTATPVPFRPSDVTPPPGQFLPTAVNPADAVIAEAAIPVPPFDSAQCSTVLETPVDVYVRYDANEPLLTLFDGLAVTFMSRYDSAGRYQINAQVGDMLLVGGWIDMADATVPPECVIISTGDLRPPLDAPPPDGFLTALPPTIVPPFEATATPFAMIEPPTFTPTPAGG